MAYTLAGVPSLTNTTQIGYDWFAGNDNYTFNIRISIVNTTTNTTLVSADTIVAPGFGTGATSTQGGLSPNTNYTLVMSIRRASNYELLGTRTATITTDALPPPSPPSWSDNFPNGTVGVSYTGSATASTTDSLTWGFDVAPSIPGLSLSYNGTTGFTLSGTPTTAGTYNFSAIATDSFDQMTNYEFEVVIAAAPQPSWDSTSFGTGKIGTFFSGSISASNATSVSANPTSLAGMSITASGSTLTLSGTPSSSGTFNTTVTASGGIGTSPDTETASVVINPLTPPVWTDQTLSSSFVVGSAYSDSVSATNSPTYSVSAGSLPSGISLNTSTGAVTGTPTTSQAYSFTLRAANTDGAVTASFSGATSAPPVWTDQTLANFFQGRAYTDSVSATNSPSYSVTSGSLPTGISLNSSTGAVTGTPTSTGSYSFTISATNSFATITASFSGTIKLAPNWTDNQLSSFINGVEFSDSVSATNTPTYSVSAGSLPAGISLNTSNGAVTGTPSGSVGTSYSFTITATNTDGSISQAFTGSIQPDLGGNLKLYVDGAWVDKEVYIYDGSAWDRGTVYIYNGVAWSKSVF